MTVIPFPLESRTTTWELFPIDLYVCGVHLLIVQPCEIYKCSQSRLGKVLGILSVHPNSVLLFEQSEWKYVGIAIFPRGVDLPIAFRRRERTVHLFIVLLYSNPKYVSQLSHFFSPEPRVLWKTVGNFLELSSSIVDADPNHNILLMRGNNLAVFLVCFLVG